MLGRDEWSVVFALTDDSCRGAAVRVCKLWRSIALHHVPKWHPAVFRRGQDMFQAIRTGNEKFYSEFASDDVWDVNTAECEDGKCAVRIAVKANQLNILRVVFADPKLNNIYPYCLIEAISFGHLEIARFLIDDERVSTSTFDDGFSIPFTLWGLAMKSLNRDLVLMLIHHPRLHKECMGRYKQFTFDDLVAASIECDSSEMLEWALAMDDHYAAKCEYICERAVRFACDLNRKSLLISLVKNPFLNLTSCRDRFLSFANEKNDPELMSMVKSHPKNVE